MDTVAIPLYVLAAAGVGVAWICWRSIARAYPPSDTLEGDEVLLED